jgi:deoxycytidylate deaminase
MMPEVEVKSGSELVIGLVAAVGTDLESAEKTLSDQLLTFGFRVEPTLRLSKLAEPEARKLGVKIKETPECDRIRTHMDAGNKLREVHGDDWLVRRAIAHISERRGVPPTPSEKTAYILRSLKHPKEVETLRRVYGPGFVLIALYSTERERFDFLTKTRRCADDDATALIKRDLNEQTDPHGQRTSDTFALADVFVNHSSALFDKKLRDFLNLLFGNPFITPEPDEYAMFLAFAASLRSGQLGRQVGAVVANARGDVVGTGCNDVPRGGGGLYWPGPGDKRDHALQYDSNDRRRDEIVEDVFQKLNNAHLLRKQANPAIVRTALADAILHEITEYGRAVHAEMEALLSCTRTGISPVGGTLYSTTFPCHNCAKHVIASGMARVVYIEPYPKSRAIDLHSDAIALEEDAKDSRVAFTPFIGIGPRRFIELFSLEPSVGRKLKRKSDGAIAKWEGATSRLRAPMQLANYLELETAAAALEEARPERDAGRGPTAPLGSKPV